MTPRFTLHHASCVLLGASGVLLRGRSGAGKSRLAMALIAAAQGEGTFARLVADDRVWLAATPDGRLIARAPDEIAGLAELRGRGIVRLAIEPLCRVRLVVDVVADGAIERMPTRAQLVTHIESVSLPRQPVAASDPVGAARLVRRALEDTLAGTLPEGV